MNARLVFLDTETTSLRPDRRVWEVGLIMRRPLISSVTGLVDHNEDDEYRWFIEADDLDLGNADLQSLKIGGYHQRHPDGQDLDHNRADTLPPGTPTDADPSEQVPYSERVVMRDLEHEFLRGATIVGAVPWFDTEVLDRRMRAHGLCPSWHYHLVDVETLAAGALRLPPPWDFNRLLAEYGLTYNEADRHTALGDARMVRDLYDAVLKDDAR